MDELIYRIEDIVRMYGKQFLGIEQEELEIEKKKALAILLHNMINKFN